MKRPMFTSFEEKAAWLRKEIDRCKHDIITMEKRGQWAAADAAYDQESKLRRELDQMIDDAQCSIPRHQRY